MPGRCAVGAVTSWSDKKPRWNPYPAPLPAPHHLPLTSTLNQIQDGGYCHRAQIGAETPEVHLPLRPVSNGPRLFPMMQHAKPLRGRSPPHQYHDHRQAGSGDVAQVNSVAPASSWATKSLSSRRVLTNCRSGETTLAHDITSPGWLQDLPSSVIPREGTTRGRDLSVARVPLRVPTTTPILTGGACRATHTNRQG